MGYVKKLIDFLNFKKVIGLDKILLRVFIVFFEVLVVLFINFINYCIIIYVWLSLWKCSNVSFFYKKDSFIDKVNYCLVFVLICFFKIFERVLYD